MLAWHERKQTCDVHGKKMAWVEEGSGTQIVFLHGNPTSSFLWRDVMKPLSGQGRLLAPDLIGMGDSDKLSDSGPKRYTLAEQSRYLGGWFDAVVPDGNVVLVLHDWGGPLGFHWARTHADRIRGIAYMETIVRPISWSEWPAPSREIFEGLRSEAGEKLILERNLFVERILPGSILRGLSAEEMDEYRRPFVDPGEDRRPTLTWPRQIPLDGEPQESAEIIAANWEWLQNWDGPKLLVDAEPGAIMKGKILDDARGLSNQMLVKVPGIHFILEDSGVEIGVALIRWLSSTEFLS